MRSLSLFYVLSLSAFSIATGCAAASAADLDYEYGSPPPRVPHFAYGAPPPPPFDYDRPPPRPLGRPFVYRDRYDEGERPYQPYRYAHRFYRDEGQMDDRGFARPYRYRSYPD